MRSIPWRFGLAILLLLSLMLVVTPPLAAQAASMAEILSQIEQIPHDPAVLGVAQAAPRRQAFSAPFQRKEFQSLDGTPLVGAMAMHPDGQLRPGVVLAHGFSGTKNQKPLIEPTSVAERLTKASAWYPWHREEVHDGDHQAVGAQWRCRSPGNRARRACPPRYGQRRVDG